MFCPLYQAFGDNARHHVRVSLASADETIQVGMTALCEMYDYLSDLI